MTARLKLSSVFAVVIIPCAAEVNHDPTPVYGDGEAEKYSLNKITTIMVYTLQSLSVMITDDYYRANGGPPEDLDIHGGISYGELPGF